ncbi:MAG: biopolymer transporter ExbD [Bacteriovoracaceae bacterium]|jgi:biopolymer transport protein ExbD|nr:biopolymer transporter ExbD [Bacteriovoracaceae bacterium]
MKKTDTSIPKLNLIPILDAIFIFIFFLLMSAQFLDIYEIGSDAPISMSAPRDDKKDILNLTIKIGKNIQVYTGLEENLVKSFSFKELDKLNKLLISLKTKNTKEDSVILKPSSSVKYDKIISVIDNIKEIKEKDKYIKVNKGGTQKLSNKLFTQVIFEMG